MSLTVEEAQRAIIILKGIQNEQLKASTIEYLKPIRHKIWHDVVQEQMIALTLELDKFFKQQADKLYKLINVEKQLFVTKKKNEESVAITKTLQAIDLIAKADEPKKYKVWQYLDRFYNRVVVTDIKDKIVEYFKSFNKELEKIYYKNIKNTYEKVSSSISTDETPFEFNKSNKWVKKRLRDNVIKWSKQVTKTTENRIKRTLIKGYKAGDSIFDIANRIKKNEGFSFSRAEKIARTEIFSAGNYIDYLSFNQNPDIVGYKWHSMEDKRVRPTHAIANGQFRKKGDPFNVGGSRLLYPGDNSLGAEAKEVICCRCYLSPIFADEIDSLEIPSGEGYNEENEHQKDTKFEKIIKEYRTKLDGIDTSEARLVKFYMDSHIVELVENTDLNIPMAYSLVEQAIHINLEHPAIKNYDFSKSITHELGHMVDDLAFNVADDKDFVKAIISAKKKLRHEFDKFDKMKYTSVMENMCISDIMSALLDGENEKLDLIFYHTKEYWKRPGMKEAEIFANLFSLHVTNNISEINLIKKHFKELYDTYKKIIGD